MNKLNEMWAALAAYQPKADAEGHGETWATMCKEKTSDAAEAAAWDAAAAAWSASADEAAWSASAAAWDAAVAEADSWAQSAIDGINKLKE
jgi:hypothetical protein